MFDSIDLFEPEGFTPNNVRPPNITFRPRETGRNNKKGVAVYQNANKRIATESVNNVGAKKSMRLSNDFNPSRRSSMRLDDGKGPSRLSSRLDDGLPTDKQSFFNLKERLEIQKEIELIVDTDNPQFIKFLKYGIRRDHNECFVPRCLGDIKIFNKKLNCSLNIPASFNSNLVVILPEDLNQWRLKDQLPEERKYVISNHNLNALIKAHFGVETAFPDNPNPIFSSHSKSQESLVSSYNASSCSETELKYCTTETVSTSIKIEPESFNPQSNPEPTKSLWETEFTIAEFEQHNKFLLEDLKILKVSLRCANRSLANAKFDVDRTESKLEFSERVTSDLFEENKEVKQKLDEVTSKAESLQSDLLESKRINSVLKQKLDE